jgi:hypothetical protein
MALIPHRRDCVHFDVDCNIVKIDYCVEECGHYTKVEKLTSYKKQSAPCSHEFVFREYIGQTPGRCICGAIVP